MPWRCIISQEAFYDVWAWQIEWNTYARTGTVVAQYHAKLRRMITFAHWWSSQVQEAIDENYQQTKKYIGGPQSQTQFEETKLYTDRFWWSQLFTSRIKNNWIRDVMGIYLRNICLWQDKILLFDCIEFNEPFRFVDVMFDVAFTVMDLEARQRQTYTCVFE